MSFKAYIDNIEAKTGLTPEGFRDAATEAGLMAPGTTATEFIDWMARDYDLGRGHAMAIYKYFKDMGWVTPSRPASKKA